MSKRINETQEEYLERRRIYISKNKEHIAKMTKLYSLKKYCNDYTNIENYELAKADNFVDWDLHHKLESHNSDGELRLQFLTAKELKALDMYWNRPAEELIFMRRIEHTSLHSSNRTKETLSKITIEATKNHCKKVHCIELDKVYDSIKEAAIEQHIDNSSIGKCCNGRQKTANGYHWEFL